jgi:alkylation response protein AidB-like acyl-CoA dehydrogenase
VDFNDNASEAAFRTEVKAWLDTNAPRRIRGSGQQQAMKMAEAKAWQAKKADAGYACLTWPREWGGGGRTSIEQVIFGREEAELGLDYAYFTIGLGMCVPTVIAFADDATKTRFVRPAVRGEEVWCQLFSEPGAGSDVAASSTRAVRDGDEWVLNGQKVWTSGAHYSDFGIVLVRTDPEAPKHKGLTMFWVDMKSPGIDVRPIRQATGESDFNEVYFADVRVKDSQRLGDVGRGWNVALVTLMNERSAVGGGYGPGWPELLALAREMPGPTGRGRAMDDGGFRDRLVEWYLQAEGLRLTRLRSLTALSRGQTPGPEASIGKIVSARLSQEVASEALDRLDQAGIVADSASSQITTAFQRGWFWGGAMRIAGGTDEILRNIVAERVLGLPGDIRADRDIAFKDLPKGL